MKFGDFQSGRREGIWGVDLREDAPNGLLVREERESRLIDGREGTLQREDDRVRIVPDPIHAVFTAFHHHSSLHSPKPHRTVHNLRKASG